MPVPPPPDSAPTLGEVMRRLDDVTSRFEATSRDIRDFRNWAERLFVPRPEWVEARKAIDDRIRDVVGDVGDLKRERESDATFRRQVLLALAVASFSALISVAIAVAGLILGKGP